MERSFVYHKRDGVTRIMHYDDDAPGGFRVFTEVEMDAVLEDIKRAREEVVPGSMNKLVARVPMTVYEQSLLEQWTEEQWKRWLNDPDNEAFRVWRGRV